jgi:hypothetical protein
MADSCMIFCSTQIPTRIVSLEPTIKGGACRSCGSHLKPGEIRVKVAYPTVFVHYHTKSGSPSFYLHPLCYKNNPVDFWRVGSSAFKDTYPVDGFVLNPATQVVGYNSYPDLHHCFQRSAELFAKANSVAVISCDHVGDPSSKLEMQQNPTTSTANQPESLDAMSDGLANKDPDAKSAVENTITPVDARLAQPLSTTLSPVSQVKVSGKKRYHALTNSQIPWTWEADREDERIAADRFQAWARKRYDTPQDVYDDLDSLTLKPPVATLSKCADCGCHSEKPERRWASPQEASEILGISSAILRNLANSREIPIFKRASGHRVYDIHAIRAFIEKRTIKVKNDNNTVLSYKRSGQN